MNNTRQRYEIQLPDQLAAVYKLEKNGSAYVVTSRSNGEGLVLFSKGDEAQNYNDAIAWMNEDIESYAEENESPIQDYSEAVYLLHIQREANWPEGFHPDGCFWCGSQQHPSDCCPNQD